ncbi:chromate efflux transporter [Dissulfurimicrobium sp.]
MVYPDSSPNVVISLFLSFLRLGLTAFGGPAMVAHIKELSVRRKGWLDSKTFNDGVALCQSIPGATAMQMAAYVGLKVSGITGALASYIGFGLPAFILMVGLSIGYIISHGVSWTASVFAGLQVIVVCIVANATFVFGRSILKGAKAVLMAVASAVFFWQGISPFFVVIGSGVAGCLFFSTTEGTDLPNPRGESVLSVVKRDIVLVAALFSGLFALYVLDDKFFHLALLMMKIDMFAFGGGFASLPLMLHEIVNVKGWLDGKTFMDGIALGQVTPGPIVITAAFVGYLLYGFAGSVVATIAVFTPSFLILVMVVPVFDRLRSCRYFLPVTKGILSSFVGLLFYVTLKFAFDIHWDVVRALLALVAFVALSKQIDVLYVVVAGAVASLIVF